jgi:hypothetical protein
MPPVAGPTQKALAEKDPTQAQKAHGLPEADPLQPENAGHQPIPQLQNRLAKPRDDVQDQNRELKHS